MAELSIAVCDDDETDMKKITEMLEQVLPRFEEQYSIETFSEATSLTASHQKFLMVFLDIEMPGMNGIKVAEEIHRRNKSCLIFFVTNHEDYMDSALNEHAFRFWTKPINRTRFIYGIKSAMLQISNELQSITIFNGRDEMRIPVHEIIYVYHSGRQTCIITITSELKTYDTYKSIAGQLVQSYFVETDKSCMVNMNFVSDYRRGEVICSYNGSDYTAPLSRRRYNEFDDRFKKWSGSKR